MIIKIKCESPKHYRWINMQRSFNNLKSTNSTVFYEGDVPYFYISYDEELMEVSRPSYSGGDIRGIDAVLAVEKIGGAAVLDLIYRYIELGENTSRDVCLIPNLSSMIYSFSWNDGTKPRGYWGSIIRSLEEN